MVALLRSEDENNQQIVPYTEQSNIRSSKSVAKARAIQEIERIKKAKLDKE